MVGGVRRPRGGLSDAQLVRLEDNRVRLEDATFAVETGELATAAGVAAAAAAVVGALEGKATDAGVAGVVTALAGKATSADVAAVVAALGVADRLVLRVPEVVGDGAVRVAAGRVWSVEAYNGGGAVVWLRVYDAGATPVVGTTVPLLTLALPAGAWVRREFEGGVQLGSGLGVGVTTGVGDADTTAPGAGTVLGLNVVYS